MSHLQGQRGKVGMTVTINRKATGKEETYHLTSEVEGDDAAKVQRAIAELNQQSKGDGDGGNT